MRDPKNKETVAIIGSGPAGVAAATELRKEGFTGRIVMMTRDATQPLDRTSFSKKLAQAYPVVSEEALSTTYGVEFIKEANVRSLNTENKTVTYRNEKREAQYQADGSPVDEKDVTVSVKFDKVLIATGSQARKLFNPGYEYKNVLTVRTQADNDMIGAVAGSRRGKKVVVIGGGFIGMEMASTLKKAGCEVTVVAAEALPLEKVVGRRVAAGFAKHLLREQITYMGNQTLKMFRGDDRRCSGVELQSGDVIPADMVVVAAGVIPSLTFDVEPQGQQSISVAKDG